MRFVVCQPKYRKLPDDVLEEYFELINHGFGSNSPDDHYDMPEGLFMKPRLYDTKELLETIIDGWLLGVYDDGIDELDVSQLEGFDESKSYGTLVVGLLRLWLKISREKKNVLQA